jgi:uncharacterized membrane protein
VVKLKHFLNRLEHERVHRAVQSAEKDTSVRIVVYISHRRVTDPMKAGHQAFKKLKLETEQEKAGLLFFIAPQSRKFAVLGGTALHEKLGQAWWDRLVQVLSADFRREKFTDGLVSVLDEIAPALKLHFPFRSRPSGGSDIVES